MSFTKIRSIVIKDVSQLMLWFFSCRVLMHGVRHDGLLDVCSRVILTGARQSAVWPDFDIELGEQFDGGFDFVESLLSQMQITRSGSNGSMTQ